VREGDLLIINGVVGVVVADPISDTALTLAANWTGASATTTYAIALFSPRHTWATEVWERVRAALEKSGFILTGSTDPGAALGVAGDVYFKVTGAGIAPVSFWTKTSSGWGAGISLAGGTPALAGLADARKIVRANSAGSAYELVDNPGANASILINGDFQINQRAHAGGALAAGVYGFDRWKADTAGANCSLAGYTLTLVSGTLSQVIEPSLWGVAALASTPVTISVWDPTNTLSVTLGSVSGQITVGSGQRSVTLTPAAGDTGNIALKIGVMSGAVAFTRIKAEISSVATGWVSRPLELSLCQRYFARIFSSNMEAIGSGTPAAVLRIFYPATMRTNPTVAIVSGTHNFVFPGFSGAFAATPVLTAPYAQDNTGSTWYSGTGFATLGAQFAGYLSQTGPVATVTAEL
jgi:hypothetical protein